MGSCLAWMKSSAASPTFLSQQSPRSPSGKAGVDIARVSLLPTVCLHSRQGTWPQRYVPCGLLKYSSWSLRRCNLGRSPLLLSPRRPSRPILTASFCSVSCPCTFLIVTEPLYSTHHGQLLEAEEELAMPSELALSLASTLYARGQQQ